MDIDVSALKALVRERNLSLDLLVETIEAALLVAYQRTPGSCEKEPALLEYSTRSCRARLHALWEKERSRSQGYLLQSRQSARA